MPLKHSTFRWFEALSCKTTSVGHPSTNRFHHLNYSMQRTKNCRFFASRHTKWSAGLKVGNFQLRTEPIRLFIFSFFTPIVKDELAVLQRRTAVELPTETRITFTFCYVPIFVFTILLYVCQKLLTACSKSSCK